MKSTQPCPYRGLDDIVRGGGNGDVDDAASFHTVMSEPQGEGAQLPAFSDSPGVV